jgi:hypothetical protein
MEEMKNPHKIFVGNPEGKSPRGRPECRWLRIGTSGEFV